MTRFAISVSALVLVLVTAGPALAHITPPVILVSDREAITGMLGGARRFFVREVRLSAAERRAIQTPTGWNPDADFYRFYVGRDEAGKLVGAIVFLTEYTIHGPVRVAVGLGPDGKVKGARVVELTEETYAWVKPLIDRDFTRAYVGRDGHGAFTTSAVGDTSMAHFYGDVIASLIQRGALLYEVGVVKRGDGA